MRPGDHSVFKGGDSIHKHRHDADGRSDRILHSCAVQNRIWVEENDVRFLAYFQLPSV